MNFEISLPGVSYRKYSGKKKKVEMEEYWCKVFFVADAYCCGL